MSNRRPNNSGRANLGSQEINSIIITPYDFLFLGLAGAVFVLYATYPDTRSAAVAGGFILALGVVLGLFMNAAANDWVGRISFDLAPINVESLPSIATQTIVVTFLASVSIGLQLMLFYYYKPTGVASQTSLVAPTDPIGALFFVEAMAIAEEWFFRFFWFRLSRRLASVIFRTPGLDWFLAALAISLVFGYGYHQVVYNGDLVLMTAAFFGSMIYCFALQYTRRMFLSQVLHTIQNFRLTGGTQTVLSLSTYGPQLWEALKETSKLDILTVKAILTKSI